MNEINLTLKIDEVNTLLSALAHQPYAQVQSLIAKIQIQGSAQLQDDHKSSQETSKAYRDQHQKASAN